MRSRRIIPAIVVAGMSLWVGTAVAQPTPMGLKAYGERLQGEARTYQLGQGQGPTALGLKAYGEGLEAEARVYRPRHPRTWQPQALTALGLKAYGERLQAEARFYKQFHALT
jgi:hypothetical protein